MHHEKSKNVFLTYVFCTNIEEKPISNIREMKTFLSFLPFFVLIKSTMSYFKLAPPPYRPYNRGGVYFLNFCAIFGPMVTKNFLGKILDIWGSWPIFFGSLSVFGQNKSESKSKSTQNRIFESKWPKCKSKKNSEIALVFILPH